VIPIQVVISIFISDSWGRETQLLAWSGPLLKQTYTDLGASCYKNAVNFCFEENFEPNSKTMPRWSNLIFPVPECSVKHGQADMRTPLLIFELSGPVPDGYLGRWTAWQRPHDELSSLAANRWLNSIATHNTQTKKLKWHFRVANFERSLLIRRSAAQYWGGRISHRPSAAPLSDTSV